MTGKLLLLQFWRDGEYWKNLLKEVVVLVATWKIRVEYGS
jgi:hypothetical protein